jgi:hypothetical protein
MPALFDPKEEERSLVRAMSGLGVPQENIATHLEIDAKTLRKHFRRELDRGMVEANVKVAQSLFQMATTGKNVAAAIFWMKARCRWREKHEVTVSPAAEKVERLSDEELQRLIRSYADSKGLVLLERDARAA